MATKQVRNIINSQLDFLLNRAEKEIRNESQKQLEKLKARIPSPQSIIDDMTVDVNNDTCSIKGSEKYDKMYNLLDNKLSNIEELLNKSLNRIDKLKEKIDPIKETRGPLGVIDDLKEKLQPIIEPLKYIVALAPLLLAAFTGPAANGPGIDRVQKGEKKAKAKIKEYLGLILSIPGLIEFYRGKAISIANNIDTLRNKISSIKEEATKLRALLRSLALQKEEGCLNLELNSVGTDNDGTNPPDPNLPLNEYLDLLQQQYEDVYNQFKAAGKTKATKRIFRINVEELREDYTTGYQVINPQD